MWYLFLQITVLLLIAAIFGAWLAWWWMKRRYEDVTETHEKLIMEASRTDRLAQLASRDELKMGFTSLSAAVSDIKPTDLSPALERLQRIEHFLAGLKMPDLQPVQQRLSEQLNQRLGPIEQRLASFNLDPVTQKVSELTSALAARAEPDLRPVADRIAALEQTIRSIRIPAPDLGPVHSGIATLQLALDKSQASAQTQPKGLDAIEELLGGLESKLVALGGLDRKLTEIGDKLEATRRADHDMTSNRLATITTSVGALRNTDLQPLAGRIDAVEQGVASRISKVQEGVDVRLSAVEEGLVSRLAQLERTISTFEVPAPDFRPLHASMIDLERAVMALDKPQVQVDLAPLHNRLAALQASLAGVQAEVRNRHALEAVEKRIASLQEAVQGIPEPDMAPVIGAVHAIDARLDLGALENRLTAIEYGLAAVHHSLRARPEQVATRTDAAWQPRPLANGPAPKPRMPAPPRPPRDADPINAVRRADDQANLLNDPAFGPPDDLEQIHGVGPMLRELLNDVGVYYFWQVAEWTPDEVAFVDSRLMHFRGRIRRDDWIEHARTLATAPSSARRPVSY